MNTLENSFLDALAADLRIEVEPAPAAQPAINPRTGQPYPTGISLEPAMGAVTETVGAAAKGAAQGFVGLPGDLIALARGVYELGKSGGDLDAFVSGLESKTGLPTTEDIKKFLDEAGLKMGSGESPAETVGELVAPGGYVKGPKKIAGKVKEILQTPPRGSINLSKNGLSFGVATPKYLASNIEYHLSVEPNLQPGKLFSQQKRTISEAGARGGSGDIYTTKSPQYWDSQLAYESTSERPKYVYLVEVKEPSPADPTGSIGHQTISKSKDVKVLTKLGESPENELFDAGLFEFKAEKFLKEKFGMKPDYFATKESK